MHLFLYKNNMIIEINENNFMIQILKLMIFL